jgi:predicted HNH restriction endonuclease
LVVWLMAMRAGNQGPSMWPQCMELGVAAITYPPLENVDLSEYPEKEPKELWDQLRSVQKSSIARLAYRMKKGDVIFVREGVWVEGRGVVKAPYQFDEQGFLQDYRGYYWRHQVRVEWEPDFKPVYIPLNTGQITVFELGSDRLRKINEALKHDKTIRADVDSLDYEEGDFEEGGKKKKYTSYYERNPALRSATVRCRGTKCEVCEFDFVKVYGERGSGYIEIHHLVPISRRLEPSIINPEKDMAVVCANCHRMIHREKDNVLTIEELREIINRRCD